MGGSPGTLYATFSEGSSAFSTVATVATAQSGWLALRALDVDLDGDDDPSAGVGNVSALAVFTCRAHSSLVATNCFGAIPNTTGDIGTFEAISSSTPSDNRATLPSDPLPASSLGFYLSSMTMGFVVNVPGSEGALCLGGDIGRYVGAGQVQDSGATGAFELAIGLTAIPQPNGAVSAITGSTWNFQAWHRDTDSIGQATSNDTDATQLFF